MSTRINPDETDKFVTFITQARGMIDEINGYISQLEVRTVRLGAVNDNLVRRVSAVCDAVLTQAQLEEVASILVDTLAATKNCKSIMSEINAVIKSFRTRIDQMITDAKELGVLFPNKKPTKKASPKVKAAYKNSVKAAGDQPADRMAVKTEIDSVTNTLKSLANVRKSLNTTITPVMDHLRTFRGTPLFSFKGVRTWTSMREAMRVTNRAKRIVRAARGEYARAAKAAEGAGAGAAAEAVAAAALATAERAVEEYNTAVNTQRAIDHQRRCACTSNTQMIGAFETVLFSLIPACLVSKASRLMNKATFRKIIDRTPPGHRTHVSASVDRLETIVKAVGQFYQAGDLVSMLVEADALCKELVKLKRDQDKADKDRAKKADKARAVAMAAAREEAAGAGAGAGSGAGAGAGKAAPSKKRARTERKTMTERSTKCARK